MKAWSHVVELAGSSALLFKECGYGQGGQCSGCNKRIEEVLAYKDDNGNYRLARKDYSKIPYGTILKIKNAVTRKEAEEEYKRPHRCVKPSIEEIDKDHHFWSYAKASFKFEWQAVEHIGVWAFGGDNKDLEPNVKEVSIIVPTLEKKEGWYFYIGPIPNIN